MRTRAIAIPSDRSNAIGSVELECTPLGLLVVYHGVGAFQTGYTPGALTTGTQIVVPWTAIREVSLDGNRLLVVVDESLTPHNRLLLSGFTQGDPPPLAERRRRRLTIRIGTFAGMFVAAVLVAVTVARLSTDGGASLGVVLGCFAAGLVFFAGMIADHKLAREGLESEGTRLAFVSELSAYVPSLAAALDPTAEPPPPPPPPVELPSFQMLLPRTTTAVVITMSAALVAAMLTANWLSRAPVRAERDPYEPPRDERLRPESEPNAPSQVAPAPAAVATGEPIAATALPTPASQRTTPAPEPSPADREREAARSSAETVTLSGGCTCKRADSLLWQDGLPRLSTVLIERHTKAHANHPHLELEIGVVNNWNESLPEVSLLVRFYERDPPSSTKRTSTFDRPLYFAGPLAPGQAIKWHVEARGNDFEVTGAASPMLDPTGADAAPTTVVAELLKAIHRPIRLHGAMMLAYLGDPRAREGALGLREALREEEAPYIDRLLWTQSDVRTCQVTVAPGTGARSVRACVFNTSPEPREHLAMKVRALDKSFRYDTPVEPPPLVVSEHVWKLEGQLGPGQGALASVTLSTENPDGIAPQAFEAYADREDVVF
ncbi:MAG TPA: hypothetical protein VH062_07465 [Polyangiaceae bacterium]|jgi:hypothetical protein|nr:hypothetical protein [Polyangiaceae bacterium]